MKKYRHNDEWNQEYKYFERKAAKKKLDEQRRRQRHNKMVMLGLIPDGPDERPPASAALAA